jgi:hypothetical protein
MGKPLDCAALREAVETWPELDRLRRLREAIVWWPFRTCEPYCATRAGDDHACTCGWSSANAARREARRLVGLENDEVQP